MPGSEEMLDDLADAVLDGALIDWAAAESSAAPTEQQLVRNLRLVASVAESQRDILPAATPTHWGHLRLLERIGHGAFGEVFRAFDTRLDREVALKLLPAAPSSDQPSASSIIQEGRLLAKVRHPNVVTIHGAEQIGGRVGLWMEFVRGRTLEQLLQEGKSFQAADVITIGVEICRAVSAVHSAGLLHRDIKAHNVMRADDGRVMLMDFGAGKELDDNSSSDLTGTPLYLAPEVLAGGPATVRSDIYSLGVLLYHLVTKSYPIQGRTIGDVRRAHEQNERVPLLTSRPDLRPALARVIERATAPQPERRFETVEAFTRELSVLQRRPAILSLRYGLAAAAVLVLVSGLVWDVRARLAGDHRSLRTRLVSLIAGAPNPVKDPVIVVLPFKNLSSEPGTRLIVDSVTDGLIRQLAIIDGLKVRSQTSSFALRDKPRDLAGIGRQLDVNLVIEGDAQLSGGKLLIRAELVSIMDARSVWKGNVDRDVKSEADVAGAIEYLTRAIVNELRLKLAPTHTTQRRYASTDIPTLEMYLRARELRAMRLGKAREAIPLFEEVIRRDPLYAPAQAALAATYGASVILWPSRVFALSPGDARALMEPLTEKALELDPMLAEAHASRGFIHSFAGRWAESEASFRHAIQLDPAMTAVYGDFVTSTLWPWGRVEESLTMLQAALDADPLSLDLRRLLSGVQLAVGQFDQALANCQRVVDVDPDFPFAEENCARALAAKGRTDEALDLFNKRPGLNEGWIGHVLAITGRHDEAEAIAARNADLPQRQALIYAGLGDKDRTFQALERLALINPARAGMWLTYSELAVLRGDPRVAAFRRKLGFPK